MPYQTFDLYKAAVRDVLTAYCGIKTLFGRKPTHFKKANDFLARLDAIQDTEELTDHLFSFYNYLKKGYSRILHDRLIMVLGKHLDISENQLNAYCARRYIIGTRNATELRGPIEYVLDLPLPQKNGVEMNKVK